MLVAFLIVFAAAALYNVGYMSVQWDEMPHLNGGLLSDEGANMGLYDHLRLLSTSF